MPTYIWEGKTKGGEFRSGTYTADSESLVVDRLQQQGLTITKVKRKPLELTLPRIGSGVGLKDMVVFKVDFDNQKDALRAQCAAAEHADRL